MPSSCSCREHQKFSDGESSYLHKISNKKIKADILQFMKTKDLVPRNCTAICQKCIDFVKETPMPQENSKRKRKFVDDVITNISSGDLSNDDLGEIAEAIGARICNDIDKDVLDTTSNYRDPSNLTSFSISKWLQERNNVLIRFLMSSAGCLLAKNNKKDACIASAVDSIYKAKRLTHIAPLPFCKNLVAYYISGSKLIGKMNSRQHPCGSYNTLKKWLRSISSQPLQTSSEGDIISFFDNNQTIARNWRVTFGHKTTASVITMVLNIFPKLGTSIQEDARISPKQWLHGYKDITTVTDQIMQRLQEDERNFNIIRNTFLSNRLNKVIMERRQSDEVQEKIDGFNGPRMKKESEDPYAWVPSEHLQEKPTVTVGEPVLCNPCSYDSVKKVLQHLHTQCIMGRRQWTCAGCDGLPYVLGSRLIDKNENLQHILLVPGHGHMEMNSVKACFKLLWDVCLQDLAKMLGYRSPRALVCCKSCTDHHKAWMILNIFFQGTLDEILTTYIKHCDSEGVTPSVTGLYQYISLSTDKNFRFLCDAIFNSVLPIFVFRSGVRRNNSKFIMAGKSKFLKLFYGFNHTYYQEIVYRELKTRVLAPREVKDFLEKTESFSVSGNASKGEGGDFVLEAVNGRSKRWLPPGIVYRELKTRVLAPREVKDFLEKTESFSVSGNASKGEGGDFVLEAVNGRSKRWLPPGIPQQRHWLEVCRNLNLLDKIRENTFKETGIEEETKGVYQRDMATEILEWRAKLRQSSYVSNTRDEHSCHISISGEVLDKTLIGFERQCNSNLNEYFSHLRKGKEPGKGVRLTPVFTTPLERTKFHDIRKKTKEQISGIIEQGISEIQNHGHTDEAFVLEGQWQTIKVKKKDDMLMFYKEVILALENATNVESDDEQDDDSDNSEDD